MLAANYIAKSRDTMCHLRLMARLIGLLDLMRALLDLMARHIELARQLVSGELLLGISLCGNLDLISGEAILVPNQKPDPGLLAAKLALALAQPALRPSSQRALSVARLRRHRCTSSRLGGSDLGRRGGHTQLRLGHQSALSQRLWRLLVSMLALELSQKRSMGLYGGARSRPKLPNLSKHA